MLGEVEEDGVEVHQDGKVGEVRTRADGVRRVGVDEIAPARRPTTRGGRGGSGGGGRGRGRVVPIHAANWKNGKSLGLKSDLSRLF